MLALRELQQRFYRAIARPHADASSADATLLGLVAGRAPLDPGARLGVYAGMYGARLIGVLEEDFPRVAAILGPERFHELAHAYLERHPSTHPSVRHMGARFAEFLADDGVPAPRPESFLSPLAALERMRLDVFDAPDCVPLALEDLRGLPPEEWGAQRLVPIAAFGVLESRWPVHEIWAAAENTEREWQPRDTVLRVWRQGFEVYQTAMDRLERLALDQARRNGTFAGMCEALEATLAPEAAAHEAGAILLRWLQDGILARARP